MRIFAALMILALFEVPTIAAAKPLPEPVTAMITEAAKSPDTLKTVVKVAKTTNPDCVAEIDALVDRLNATAEAEHQAKLANGGLFDNWSGSGQVGFSKTTGNTDDTTISLGLKLTKDGLKFRHKLNGDIDREASDGVESVARYLANYELDYKFTSRFYAYGLFGWDRDTFAGFSHRFSESAGLGYTLFKTKTMNLDLTAGPGLRQTHFVTGLTEDATTARAGVDFSWKVFDKVTLSELAGVFFDGAFTSTTALTGAISDKVSARLSFDVNHESDLPPGRKLTDTATKATLVYGF